MNELTCKVTTIPATRPQYSAQPAINGHKRRVAAYARVSTAFDEQSNSFEAQIDYYTNYIKNRVDWEFVDVYTDVGITGTSTLHREGFKRMVDDALGGKIDLIVTKSVSRFARNTVDSLATIRKLKEQGVECFFEKENIWTFDGKGELLITIMSSLAQEESRSLSENCTWGQRKRMQDGRVSLAYSHFVGYDRGPDGKLVINPEEAEIIRRIYSLFLQGKSPHKISQILNAEGFTIPGKRKTWYSGTVNAILRNEKYKGDALMQKTFNTNYLAKKMVRNTGQLPMYYVHGDHEAIIDPKVFDRVQRELKRHDNIPQHPTSAHTFSCSIYCGECGGIYGSGSRQPDKMRKQIKWICYQKIKHATECSTPTVDDGELKRIFMSALKKVIENRDRIKKEFESDRQDNFGINPLEDEKRRVRDELDRTSGKLDQLIRENAVTALDQNAYNIRYDEINNLYNGLKARLDTLEAEIQDKLFWAAESEDFITDLMQLPPVITDFDPLLYHRLVDRITVFNRDKVVVRFRNAMEIEEIVWDY